MPPETVNAPALLNRAYSEPVLLRKIVASPLPFCKNRLPPLEKSLTAVESAVPASRRLKSAPPLLNARKDPSPLLAILVTEFVWMALPVVLIVLDTVREPVTLRPVLDICRRS